MGPSYQDASDPFLSTMALETYRKKRNFKTTPEPSGRVGKRRAKELAFVIQKHAASRLHYDFRLELNGVLLSWAVPKGPSLDPQDKRLAVHVEDHPLEYGSFEGIIPPKQYGSGTVMLWDAGTWKPREEPEAGYRKGRLKFDLHGEKLQGGWMLVRTRGSKYGNDKSWLLIKEQDEFARPAAKGLVVEEEPDSVASGRSLKEITEGADRVWHSNKSVAQNVNEGAIAPQRRKRARAAAGSTGRKTRRSPARTSGRASAFVRGGVTRYRAALSAMDDAVAGALPRFVEPELATLVKEAPRGPEWLHEMKLDGYRILSRIEHGKVRLYTRNRNDWTEKFSSIAEAVAGLPIESGWLDGEIVVMKANGLSSFQALQNALSREDTGSLHYYVFDVPFLDGRDLRKAPLLERKSLLEKVLSRAPQPIRYSSHVVGSGEEFYGQACKLELEGIVSKRSDSAYTAGRGRDWLKIKCGLRQEMVIGGYTDPAGARSGLGALLLGVYEPDGTLRYSGKVGTGFDHATLIELRDKLDGLASKEPPFSNPPRGAEARRAHWVKPRLVAEIVFTEWTDEGTLRHPSFQGLREDKNPRDVIRERPAADPSEVSGQTSGDGGQTSGAKSPAKRQRPGGKGQASGVKRHASRATGHKPRAARDGQPAMSDESRVTSHESRSSTVAGITLSHPDKVMYPEAGITKRDLALYYEAVAERILPHLKNRPLSLVRCPDGWHKHCFYQKHVAKGVHKAVGHVRVPEGGGKATYMMANSLPAVVALVQMGVLELHPWGSTERKLGFPDRVIFDIDPDDDLPWSKVADAARLVNSLLEEIGLRGFLKTTGGKGLHVVAPVRPTQDWDTVKAFTKSVAELLAKTFPDRFTATMSKAARRGRIYIDYLRNAEGATSIVAYGVRARANAPVSVPIAWSELGEDVRFDRFNVRNVPARLKRMKKDPWEEFFEVSQSVTAAMIRKFQV